MIAVFVHSVGRSAGRSVGRSCGRSRFTIIIIIRVVFDHTIYPAVSVVVVLFVTLFFSFPFLVVKMHQQKRQNICHSNIRFNGHNTSLAHWPSVYLAFVRCSSMSLRNIIVSFPKIEKCIIDGAVDRFME